MEKVTLWKFGLQGVIRLFIPAENEYKGGIQTWTLQVKQYTIFHPSLWMNHDQSWCQLFSLFGQKWSQVRPFHTMQTTQTF